MDRVGRKDKFKCTKGEKVTLRFESTPSDGVKKILYAINRPRKPYPKVENSEFEITIDNEVMLDIFIFFDPVQKKALTEITLTTASNSRGFKSKVRWSESPPTQTYQFVV